MESLINSTQELSFGQPEQTASALHSMKGNIQLPIIALTLSRQYQHDYNKDEKFFLQTIKAQFESQYGKEPEKMQVALDKLSSNVIEALDQNLRQFKQLEDQIKGFKGDIKPQFEASKMQLILENTKKFLQANDAKAIMGSLVSGEAPKEFVHGINEYTKITLNVAENNAADKFWGTGKTSIYATILSTTVANLAGQEEFISEIAPKVPALISRHSYPAEFQAEDASTSTYFVDTKNHNIMKAHGGFAWGGNRDQIQEIKKFEGAGADGADASIKAEADAGAGADASIRDGAGAGADAGAATEAKLAKEIIVNPPYPHDASSFVNSVIGVPHAEGKHITSRDYCAIANRLLKKEAPIGEAKLYHSTFSRVVQEPEGPEIGDVYVIGTNKTLDHPAGTSGMLGIVLSKKNAKGEFLSIEANRDLDKCDMEGIGIRTIDTSNIAQGKGICYLRLTEEAADKAVANAFMDQYTTEILRNKLESYAGTEIGFIDEIVANSLYKADDFQLTVSE